MAFPHPTTKYHNVPTAFTDPTLKHLSAAGKIVLVTGGGTTLGTAIVEAFAKAKTKDIFLTGRRINLLKDVEKKVQIIHNVFSTTRLTLLK
jgi:NADP-dependent 3-hydroxy acid dehydrogenase YdfG